MRNTVLLQMVATEIAVATDLTIDTTIETTTTVLYKRVGSKRAGSKLAKISTLTPLFLKLAPPMPLLRHLATVAPPYRKLHPSNHNRHPYLATVFPVYEN